MTAAAKKHTLLSRARNPAVDVVVRSRKWGDGAAAKRMARRAVNAAATLVTPLRDGPCITLTLVSDAQMRVLNREWRGYDKPTNVLSFPNMPEPPRAKNAPWLLGDIVIAYETVARETQAEGKKHEHHFIHMVVHGALHLLGYDHMNAKDATRMEKLEIAILKLMSIPNPYA